MQGGLSNVRRNAPLYLLALLLLAPVMFVPNTGAWQGMKWFAMQAVVFASLVFLLAKVRWSPQGIRQFLATGPNLALVLLVGWAGLSFVSFTNTALPEMMTTPPARLRDIAMAELLRLVGGAILFFAAMYRCSSRERLNSLLLLLLGGGVLASVSGLLSYSTSASNVATAAFGNSQLLASFLVLLLPVAVVFAQQGAMNARRIFALTAAVMVIGTLFLTQNRSAWIGAAVGLVVVALLAVKTVGFREVRTQKHLFVAPALAALVAIGAFFALSNTGEVVGARAQTLTAAQADGSFQWRMGMWDTARKMIADKPLTGRGIGSFPMVAGYYSNHQAPSVHQVKTVGADLASVPHNEYLQIAAELGLVGLGLYLAVLAGFFVRGFKALSRIGSDTRKWMLIACMGAIAAQCVDALGNPGWRFADVSPLFWLILGTGMAATRTHRERQEVGEVVAVRNVRPAFGFGRLGWQALSAVLAIGLMATSYAAVTGHQVDPLECNYEGPQPQIEKNPERLDFGTVAVGRTVDKTFTISNVGERGSVLRGTVAINKTNPFFLLGPNNFELQAGQSTSFTVRFTPVEADVYFKDITVNSNDCETPVGEIEVVGNSEGETAIPQIEKGPLTLDFGTVRVGSQATRQLTIRNVGDPGSRLVGTVRNPSDNPFFVTPGTFDLKAGESTVISVRFAPIQEDSHNFELEVESNDPNDPLGEVAIVAESTGPDRIPDIRVSAETVNFGSVNIGSSRTRTVTITNVGDRGSLLVGSVELRAQIPFSFPGARSTFSLGRNESITATIRFAPQTEGDFSENLLIQSNDPETATGRVNLAGTGVGREAFPDIEVDPTRVSFGRVAVGREVTRSIVIRNEGDSGSLLVGRIRLQSTSNNSFSILTPRSFSIRNGESRTVTIQFRPSSGANFANSLVIESNDPRTPNGTVRLSGTGFRPTSGASVRSASGASVRGR